MSDPAPCAPCAPGAYATAEDLSSCLACAAGTFGTAPGLRRLRRREVRPGVPSRRGHASRAAQGPFRPSWGTWRLISARSVLRGGTPPGWRRVCAPCARPGASPPALGRLGRARTRAACASPVLTARRRGVVGCGLHPVHRRDLPAQGGPVLAHVLRRVRLGQVPGGARAVVRGGLHAVPGSNVLDRDRDADAGGVRELLSGHLLHFSGPAGRLRRVWRRLVHQDDGGHGV